MRRWLETLPQPFRPITYPPQSYWDQAHMTVKENDMANKKNTIQNDAANDLQATTRHAHSGTDSLSGIVPHAPDYYQLSYLKRAGEGALWERHTEYHPTHDESTTRALALSAAGDTACVRTLPRYWAG